MEKTLTRVAHVLMPEKGLFTVRCTDEFEAARGARVVVNLDYGLDLAELRDISPYDSARDGAHPPGFTLVRLANPEDLIAATENETRARELRSLFLEAARSVVPDIRVPYARLALGGGRLFVRYVCDRLRPDLRGVLGSIRRKCRVLVSAWQMGPRDEVRVMGALGPCGRVCCCSAWQQKYPNGLTPDALKCRGQNTAALNGTCGRFKCCLAFERYAPHVTGKTKTTHESDCGIIYP